MHNPDPNPLRWTVGLLLCTVLCGCGTVKKAALNSVSDMLAGGTGGSFASDDDPELVREAIPFGLKLQESLLEANPTHRGLHLAAGSGFVQYANAFVEADADEIEEEDYRKAKKIRARASKLYARGRDYALKGLELDHPNFGEQLRTDPAAALSAIEAGEVDLLYWAGAGWAGAISANTGSMAMVGDLPMAEKIMRRALELDEDYDRGALHEFFLVFEGSRSEAMGGSAERALTHYQRALELQEGKKASPHVALAGSVAVRNQDMELFNTSLEKALAVDVDAVPEWRLVNILAQRKARRMLAVIGDLFLEYEEVGE